MKSCEAENGTDEDDELNRKIEYKKIEMEKINMEGRIEGMKIEERIEGMKIEERMEKRKIEDATKKYAMDIFQRDKITYAQMLEVLRI